ncbi:hypothetical protein Taro_051452, partial [Colocasia esculenta]|nr:hypothetical protein [Colocasia esculenta]
LDAAAPARAATAATGVHVIRPRTHRGRGGARAGPRVSLERRRSLDIPRDPMDDPTFPRHPRWKDRKNPEVALV